MTEHLIRREDCDAVGLWIASHLSPHTRRSYERIVKGYLESHPLLTATGKDLIEWRDSLTGSDASIQLSVSALKSLFSFLHNLAMIPQNIGAILKVPAVHNRLSERILTVDEVGAIIREAYKRDPKYGFAFTLCYYTGLRLEELTTVCWRDLNCSVLSVFGKGAKQRYITLPDWLSAKIELLRGNPESLIVGVPARSLEWALKKCAVAVGAPSGTSPHWLRHANASHALQNNASIAVVSQTLGHSNIATTSRYLHIMPGESTGKYLPRLGEV